MFSFETFVRINSFLANGFRLMYLNLLWLVTTAIGLVLFGAGPASYALAKYVDRWFRHGEQPPMTRTFLAYVRERYWRSTVVGWIYLGAGTVIVTNVFAGWNWYVQMLNVFALVAFTVSLFYVFSVMAALELRTIRDTIAASLLIGFGSLHWTVIGGTAVFALTFLMSQQALPLLILFGVAIPAAAAGLITRVVYRDLEPTASQWRNSPGNDARSPAFTVMRGSTP
ncbi:YesL family protein [Phytoactinopolyspora endophytica]|uniref:YesL family protein n=1 Tax=Phytoactinopolyspora endophytica TaxID=1642495 RepID=UPI0013EAA3CD|nr:DUF624 domain-containing protein [Phytoactinopolyspora endophytica]